MMRKVKGLLTESDGYLSATDLSKKCKMSKQSVYNMIRNLRLGGVGIIPGVSGYVLSEYAKKNDDVYFLRRLHGQRTGAFIALRAAEPDIRNRWRGVTARDELKLLTAPLKVDLGKMTDCHDIFLKYNK
jgi:biotin operon repressor